MGATGVVVVLVEFQVFQPGLVGALEGVVVLLGVSGFESAASIVEGTELDGDLGRCVRMGARCVPNRRGDVRKGDDLHKLQCQSMASMFPYRKPVGPHSCKSWTRRPGRWNTAAWSAI